MTKPPAPRTMLLRPRYGFEPYRAVALEFFQKICGKHYTELVITDESLVGEFSYLCIEDSAERYTSSEEAMVVADRLMRARIRQHYNIYLDVLDGHLYVLFEQIKNQKVLH